MKFIKKIMVYIFIPLFFLLLAYLLIYFIIKPMTDPYISIYNIISKNTPNQSNNSYDIFEASKENYPENIQFNDIKIPNFESQYGRIIIEKVGIDLPLFYGDSYDPLQIGAGQYIGSALPGLSKPTMIAGHAFPYFKPLANIEKGDEIKITTHYGVFFFEVTDKKVFNKDYPSAYDLSKKSKELILYTCWPMDTIAYKKERLFVYAKYIEGTKIIGDPYEK